MTRPPSIDPPVKLQLSIPESIRAKLEILLYSDLESRVPFGAYRQFFIDRVEELSTRRHLDLAPWAGTDPGACIVSGSAETLEILKRTLVGDYPR